MYSVLITKFHVRLPFDDLTIGVQRVLNWSHVSLLLISLPSRTLKMPSFELLSSLVVIFTIFYDNKPKFPLFLLAQASLVQIFDKTKCIKITCCWWRSVQRSCFYCIKSRNNMLNVIIPHLVSLDEKQQTLVILYRHNYIDKGWRTGVPHLVGLSWIIASTIYMLRYSD